MDGSGSWTGADQTSDGTGGGCSGAHCIDGMTIGQFEAAQNQQGLNNAANLGVVNYLANPANKDPTDPTNTAPNALDSGIDAATKTVSAPSDFESLLDKTAIGAGAVSVPFWVMGAADQLVPGPGTIVGGVSFSIAGGADLIGGVAALGAAGLYAFRTTDFSNLAIQVVQMASGKITQLSETASGIANGLFSLGQSILGNDK